jgi:2,4-dienoyl-CoA reductase-like NADH-dependent reductase (Old Yellow Enzyme family)
MKHFKYKSLAELAAEVDRLQASEVRFERDAAKVTSLLSRPVDVSGFRVGNSMAIHPMEGCDGRLDGAPDELTWRRYQRFAEGGAKLIWFEATAVREEGRANSRQLWLHAATQSEFARLLAKMHEVHRTAWGSSDDVLIPMQLTHSGRYSYPTRVIGYHNPNIDASTKTAADYPVISDGELERLEDDYVATAKLAWEAGFRAFDVKITHGYLLSELMGARDEAVLAAQGTAGSKYRGSIENRSRFALNVLGKIRAALGKNVLLGMRLGCFDSVPYRKNEATSEGEPIPYSVPYSHGFGVDSADPLQSDLSDVKRAITLFRDAGLQFLNVSLGVPYYNPHVGRPFESPDEGNYEQPEHPLLGVNRHFQIAGALQRAFPDLPMVGTGYSWLQTYAANAAAYNIETGGIRFFGYGRGALAYPDFARAILERGSLEERRVCKTLTYCTYLMRQKNHPLGQFPTGCPPFDKEGYGSLMKEARALHRIAKAPA